MGRESLTSRLPFRSGLQGKPVRTHPTCRGNRDKLFAGPQKKNPGQVWGGSAFRVGQQREPVMASHVEDCLISLEGTAVVMGERTPPPPTSVSSKTELIFYPVVVFFYLKECNVKKSFLSTEPRRFIMGKSVPLSPPGTKLVLGKLAVWAPSMSCTGSSARGGDGEICQSLGMLASECVIAMILLLKITTMKTTRKPQQWKKLPAVSSQLLGGQQRTGKPPRELPPWLGSFLKPWTQAPCPQEGHLQVITCPTHPFSSESWLSWLPRHSLQ